MSTDVTSKTDAGPGDPSQEEDRTPLVSVVIPTCNRSALLRRAVQSVLNQTWQRFELIIVDDASHDGSADYVRSLTDSRIRFIHHQRNLGGAAARNTGILAARGKYIAFLDDDDRWFPEKLERQVDALQRHPEYGLAYSNWIVVDSQGTLLSRGAPERRFPSGDIYHDVLLHKSALAWLQATLIRRECFDDVGLLDADLPMAHDRELVIRLARRFKILGMPEQLTIVTKHSGPRLRGRPWREKQIFLEQVLQRALQAESGRLSERVRRQMISTHCYHVAVGLMSDRDFAGAREQLWKSIQLNPWRPNAYLLALGTVIGRRLFDGLAAGRRSLRKSLLNLSWKKRKLRVQDA